MQSEAVTRCMPFCTYQVPDIDAFAYCAMSWILQQRTKQFESYTLATLQEARVLNHATWNPLAQLGHPGSVTSPETAVIYKEIVDTVPSQVPSIRTQKSHYIVCQLPAKVPQQKVPLDKPNVRLGVGKQLLIS